MNEYIVSVRYTAWANVIVEARDQNEAEELAWREINMDADHYTAWGEWATDSVEEVKESEAAE